MVKNVGKQNDSLFLVSNYVFFIHKCVIFLIFLYMICMTPTLTKGAKYFFLCFVLFSIQKANKKGIILFRYVLNFPSTICD